MVIFTTRKAASCRMTCYIRTGVCPTVVVCFWTIYKELEILGQLRSNWANIFDSSELRWSSWNGPIKYIDSFQSSQVWLDESCVTVGNTYIFSTAGVDLIRWRRQLNVIIGTRNILYFVNALLLTSVWFIHCYFGIIKAKLIQWAVLTY